MTTSKPTAYDTILYRVRTADSLGRIIQNYHGPITKQQQDTILSRILADNPDIKNPDRIFPNQLIKMSVPQRYCSATTHPDTAPVLSTDQLAYQPLRRQWQQAAPQERAWLSTLTPIMLGTGSASMTMVNRTFLANTPLLNEMVHNYEAYKAGELSKGQYDYRRYKILGKLKTKLGPLARILNTTRLQNEVLRISRTKGRAPTQNITRQIGRMGRAAKYASRGGVVLSTVGLGVACNDIANTGDINKKNAILVESVGSIVGGTAFGFVSGMAIVAMATPVGWVASLVIGVGSAVAGYVAGKGFSNLYDTYGRKIDIASATGVASLCSR